jgi:peroxiredoxin
MRVPDILGVLAALVVGAILAVFLLASAIGTQPALPSPVTPTLPPLPTLALVSQAPGGSPSAPPVATGSLPAPLATGQMAPALQVTLVDGSVMNTQDFAGTPMWVTFMATWTPQTPAELAMETDYAKQLGDQMNELVIDEGEDTATVKAFIKDQKFNLPVGVDTDGSAARAWGAYALPVHYFLDGDGTIQQIVYGGAPEAIFIQAITAVVPDFSAEAPTPQPSIPLELPSDTPVPVETASPAQ